MSEQQAEQIEIQDQVQNTLLNTPPAEEGGTIQTAEGEWLLSSDVKGVGDKPDWFKGEKYKTVQAQAEAYNSLESKFGSFTGAPDDYEMVIPEGMDVQFDEERLGEAKTMFKEMGMDQAGFNKAMEWYLGEIAGDPEAEQVSMQQQVQEVLGDKSAQRISQVSGALSNMLDAKTYAEIAPYANTPEAIRLVEAVILATAPKVPPIDGGTNPEGFSMQKLTEMRSERIKEGPNTGSLRFHKDAGFRKQIDEYSKALHGSE